jgi:hypothetical protein
VAQIKLQIGDEMKPLSPTDEARRAYFFCRELESRSLAYVRQACSAHGINLYVSMDLIDEQVKLLSWTLVYLVAIYCGGIEAQGWLLDFIARAMKICDEYTEDSDMRKFLKNLGGLTEEGIKQKVAARMAARLSIRDKEFEHKTREFLTTTSNDGLDLLTTSLVLPIETLRDLVQLINTNE